MWPVFVDYSDEECKKALRSIELEAYSAIINAFRAQGTLTRDRKRMLQELSAALSISMERHRSEVRRVINDEHLSTIAERLFGPNTVTDWAIEGRRVVPLMQRLAPQTAFTEIANSAATNQAAKNSSMPLPGKTGSREVASGIETMTSRKRKDAANDWFTSSRKIAAMDSQYFHSLPTIESPILEPLTVPDIPMICEGSNSPEIISPVSSFEINASKNTTAFTTSQSSSSKTAPIKSTPTLSSFDQLTSNLLASRAASKTFVPAVLHEEQVSTVCDASLQSSDLKSPQRPSSSHSTVKSSSNASNPSSSSSSSSVSSTSSSKDRLQNLPCSSQSNKFLSQIRSKTPTHARQNLPAGLGIKLSTQSHANQRNTISPKSPIKATTTKQDNSPTLKKTSPTPDNPSSNNESISSIPKSPKTKIECQPNAKPQLTAPKTLPKTTQHNSQFVSRSLFTTGTGPRERNVAKSLSPVIFNVSTPSCTSLQIAPKTTGASQSEAGKPTTQLVASKSSTAVGMTTSHVKINTSNTQTFHYRNDGGMVRSARIVNITQPVGSRLPCAISPSAISALGLSAGISSTALRVTLPAGSLNTNSSIRVAAAQKPNVIVVHKAQMYQRPSQGGAVIMTSAPMSKVSNDIAQETYSITQKQDKNKPSGSKTTPRAIPSARPQSPAVSVPEKTSDAQCKKNLLADIIQASGILLEDAARKNALMKEKNNAVKNNKEFSNHEEVEIISQKGPVSSTSETKSMQLSDSSISKMESANNLSGNTALKVTSLERNGVDSQKQGMAQAQSVESQSKDTCNTVVSSLHITNKNVTSSESGSKGHRESTKDDS